MNFTREANPAVDKEQSTRDQAQARRGWPYLESRLREVAKVARDSHEPLALLLNRRNPASPIDAASLDSSPTAINLPDSAAQAVPAVESSPQAVERKQERFGALSYLASIPFEQS